MEIPRHIGAHVDSLTSSTVLFAVSFDTIIELSKSNERWSAVRLPPVISTRVCRHGEQRRSGIWRSIYADEFLRSLWERKKKKKKKENKNLEEIFSMNIFVFFLLFFVSIVVKWRMFVEISILHGGQKFEDVLMCL